MRAWASLILRQQVSASMKAKVQVVMQPFSLFDRLTAVGRPFTLEFSPVQLFGDSPWGGRWVQTGIAPLVVGR